MLCGAMQFGTEYDWSCAACAKKKPRFDHAKRGFLEKLVALSLSSVQQFGDTKGEEGSNAKVD
jgi:hypothetical protein